MQDAPRFASLIGLGFGDCGKGLFTDALCRRWPVGTVVRYNGGAQAGHNVVLPDGRHHTFSQFGAGTFVEGVRTLLAAEVVVHPTALLVEASWLRRAGVGDALRRLSIDARCRLTTPFHQAAGRLREWRRGAGAHGSCGVGVGETVLQGLRDPAQALRYGDLPRRGLALEKLDALQSALAAEFRDMPAHAGAGEAMAAEMRLLADPAVAARWLDQAQALARQVPPAGKDAVSRQLSEAGGATGSVLFEGAQGMLLDEWRGFHPHTTWSTVGPGAVEAVLRDAGVQAPVRHFGILRTYPTRHGAGPFPTWDPALDLLPEPHNASDGWQGAFRRGHPDSVLLRYATDAAGPLHGLLLSHADALAGPVGLRWCSSYEAPATPGGDALLCERAGGQPGGRITRLLTGEGLPHQEALTVLLKKAKPVYEEGPGGCGSPGEFIERLQAVAACPVRLVSQGPTHRDVMPPAESP